MLLNQLTANFLLTAPEELLIRNYYPQVLLKLESNFSQNLSKYYFDGHDTLFNALNGDHYATFLYLFSREIYLGSKDTTLASKLFYLNKMLNACDLFYEVKLPEFFHLVHPYASGLGKSIYGNYLKIYQCCNVGANGTYRPVFEENVIMYAGSSVFGNSHVGKNVIFSAGAFVMDTDIPSNSLVFGRSPNLVIKPITDTYFYSKSSFKEHAAFLL